MKITFDQITGKMVGGKSKNLLYRDILRNLTEEHFSTLHNKPDNENKSFDVQLTVNGISLEPTILSSLYNKIFDFIDKEAKALFDKEYAEKKEELNRKLSILENVIKDSTNKIATEFDVEIDANY